MKCLHCEKETGTDIKKWCNGRCNFHYYRDRYRAGDFPEEESEVRICANIKCGKEFKVWIKFYNSMNLICCCRRCAIQRSAINATLRRRKVSRLTFDRSEVCKREEGALVEICGKYDEMVWKGFPCFGDNCFCVEGV
ncbi:hypothetical protein KAR91_12070 [Candidatus Pacearchaeota archaeon]|nr:hypothetical protein [Candidatus Pacearchaeota archaeon]